VTVVRIGSVETNGARIDAGTHVDAGTRREPTGAVRGPVRTWLRLEGAAALVLAVGVYVRLDGQLLWLVPLLLLVDLSMVGYLIGPSAGAFTYNVAHNWAVGAACIAIGAAAGWVPLVLLGAILVGHVGFDRLAGYGLKYPTAFADTHLGWIGR
jgi:hypothetical protein